MLWNMRRKYHIIDGSNINLLSVQVFTCLICEIDTFLKNIIKNNILCQVVLLLYMIKMETCFCRTFSGDLGILMLCICILDVL